ncbi:hypothetical protein PAMP_007720 [Pampus punctatissimus]
MDRANERKRERQTDKDAHKAYCLEECDQGRPPPQALSELDHHVNSDATCTCSSCMLASTHGPLRDHSISPTVLFPSNQYGEAGSRRDDRKTTVLSHKAGQKHAGGRLLSYAATPLPLVRLGCRENGHRVVEKPLSCPTCRAEQVTVNVRNDGHSPTDSARFAKEEKGSPKLELAPSHHLLQGRIRESAKCQRVRPIAHITRLHYS